MRHGFGTQTTATSDAVAYVGGHLAQDFRSVSFTPCSHLAGPENAVLGSALGEEVYLRHGLPAALQSLVLTHELAHVAQRRNATRGTGRPGKAAELEEEADRAALAVAQGRQFSCVLADVEGVARAWAEAGHYYTCYFVMLAAGVDPDLSAKQACFAQMPDQVNEFDATKRGKDFVGRSVVVAQNPLLGWLEQQILKDDIDVQRGLHCLTGSGAEAETVRRRSILERAALDSFEFGLGLHPFGDSYAHRTLSNPKVLYSAPFGHLKDMHRPDQIDQRPDLYVRYGEDLYDVITNKLPGKARLDRAGVSAKLRSFAAISSTPNENAEIFQIRLGAMGDLSTPNNPAGFVLMNGYKPEFEEPTSWAKYRTMHGFGPQMLMDTMGFAKKWAVPAVS